MAPSRPVQLHQSGDVQLGGTEEQALELVGEEILRLSGRVLVEEALGQSPFVHPEQRGGIGPDQLAQQPADTRRDGRDADSDLADELQLLPLGSGRTYHGCSPLPAEGRGLRGNAPPMGNVT